MNNNHGDFDDALLSRGPNVVRLAVKNAVLAAIKCTGNNAADILAANIVSENPGESPPSYDELLESIHRDGTKEQKEKRVIISLLSVLKSTGHMWTPEEADEFLAHTHTLLEKLGFSEKAIQDFLSRS